MVTEPTDQRSASAETWALVYDDWNPETQPLREALCTLGNGYFATRGAAEEAKPGGQHYPGTYLASGYNRLESEIAGRIIENEDLVNWPNWLSLSFRCEGEDWFHIDTADLLAFEQRLDLYRGVLERRLRFRHGESRETSLVCRRIVHMDDPHLAALAWELKPENWSGTIEIRSAIDGAVSNRGVERYRDLNAQHLDLLDSGRIGEDAVYLAVQTNQSHIRMVQAARTRVYLDGEAAVVERETLLEGSVAEQRLTTKCEQEKPLRIEKVVALYTSRDFAISEPGVAAREAMTHAGSFKDLLDSHCLAWERLWRRADIEIRDDAPWSQLVLRVHIFHLLQTASFNTISLDAGVPARGLHGEAYRGHIFWDELFIFPFLNLRIPELTRGLLMYRYRRLDAARRLARSQGHAGAMYPWQSGSSGREESQEVHLNPESGRWVPDNTHKQRHINAAVAYNVWQYFQSTGDHEFLTFYGAEMLLEIARFFSSIATYNAARGRYEIGDVVGPDEFHTQYPGREGYGLDNNAYTNVMAVWVLRLAGRLGEVVAEDRLLELREKLGIDDEELRRWDDVSRHMYVPFHGDRIISQFEGYADLEEFDWRRYQEKYEDIQRLDRILEAEGDSPNHYKASKQADVLMLFYLFSCEELIDLFAHMEYAFDPDMIPANIQYYVERTSNGSTLSRVVHSWVVSRSDRGQSWDWFSQALRSDVADIQGGTTSEGIHLGAMAGTVDLVQRCYTGIEPRDDVLWLNPYLPEKLDTIRLRIRYRGHWLQIEATQTTLAVSFEHGWSGPAKIGFRDEVYTFCEGDRREFDIDPDMARRECDTD